MEDQASRHRKRREEAKESPEETPAGLAKEEGIEEPAEAEETEEAEEEAAAMAAEDGAGVVLHLRAKVEVGARQH